ncbi:hypothetical protein BO94DRAFT_455239 [Aspergillus sclerotioniger CBS 115572]|uniref:Uncharacterized protein n=1 Tax=Aspergillus sclerotioniger CBS 115572 TaxID=1450535 RepID=A0A317XDX9_9EURO|nr:hypothetical protein BO94DRAFT_455239 [Aspergillus sclerotioniger CBS 115572]PWY95952.1 hypothetical protein BO94DRAFT_455239 [Aspergillus sclerotioniger CBS 115572]
MDQALVSERATRRHALAKIESLIKQAPSHHIEVPELKAASIRHFPLSLEEGTQDQPCFSEPYQGKLPPPEKEDKFLELTPDPNNITWNTRDLEYFLCDHFNDCCYDQWGACPDNLPPSGQYREMGDYRFGQLLECITFNWEAIAVTDYQDGKYPHFKAMVASEAMGDDRLLRGEIMTITDIMAARLRTKSLRPHIVAPILVFSLVGLCHARVLEADFDGEMLNIRSSKLYDFTKKNTDAVKLLTRYWFGGARGQTMMKPT